ncbi:MAG: nuclease-related domain-containing protein [Rubrobacteraceae bacterium]
MGQAVVGSSARTPYGSVGWSGKNEPQYGISVSDIRTFSSPILYKFPKKGPHPSLGFHPYALTGGFLTLSEEGFEDVLGWTRRVELPSTEVPVTETVAESSPEIIPEASSEAPQPGRFAETRRIVKPSQGKDQGKTRDPGSWQKRVAGQHALKEGRKRAVLWGVAELGAGAFKLKGVERFAREKVREAERSWVAGGRAEEQVGVALEQLREHGFYLFHDVSLPGIGNVDHVVLGPPGFFAIETKSHKGRVEGKGGKLLINGYPPEKDFVKQTWSGAFRIREILGAEVVPLLCFTRAFVTGRLRVRGVRVFPLRWLAGEILEREPSRSPEEVKVAVNALGKATGCYPSAGPTLHP